MNYLVDLTNEELKYICCEIPFQEGVAYFKRYPKEFAKLRPGFRVKSLSYSDVAKILYDFRNRDYIASFIVKHINRWIQEIDEELSRKLNDGLDQVGAYINVLSRSFFAQNVPLFFKIKEEKKAQEYLEILSAAVLYQFHNQSDIDEEISDYNKELANKNSFIEKSKKEIEESTKTIAELRTRLREMKLMLDSYFSESEEKKREIIELSDKIEQLKNLLNKKEDVMVKKQKEFSTESSSLKAKIEKLSYEKQLCLETIGQLEEELAIAKEEGKPLEVEEYKFSNSSMPLKPENMEDFDEYFVYNLNNIGFDESTEAFVCFVEYFEEIIFEGMPLLVKHGPGINLANCIANAIYGKRKVAVLPYSEDISSNAIEKFLSNVSDRVVCLDGFIGNCNEMELIPLLDRFRNKIIFVTYMYDRTLKYIPAEILIYFRYLNVDEIKPLLRIKDITEDPSTIMENVYTTQGSGSGDNRYRRIFVEIAMECGLQKNVINVMASSIDGEKSMNNALIYTLLPYVSYVLQINPYNCSKRLQKYAGENGKCPKKELIMRWFG